MAIPSPHELGAQIGAGLLSFPVTHFDGELEFDEAAYRDHLSWLSGYPVAGLFAAGGTGEYFSLSPREVERVVAVAVDEVDDRLPVLAPAGVNLPLAVEQARSAAAAGASGLLLFPPYLTEASQDGLVAYVQAVCAASALGVIVYHRANGRLGLQALRTLAATCPNLIGFKDGVGDIELLTKITTEFGDRFTYVGGLPTAEVFALPYLQLGMTTYSSAIFNFTPEFALDFYAAVRRGDDRAVSDRLRSFVLPYVELRDRKNGYAVSIVKAGLAAVGRPSSGVRPPLTSLTPSEFDALAALVEQAGIARMRGIVAAP